jgi:hypothetical protein
MAVFGIEVDVALVRPPTVDETRYYVVEAPDEWEAALIAGQMAACTSIMPLGYRIINWEENDE